MVVDVRSATYRLYPKKDQERKMILFLDGTRKVYNQLVERCRIYIGFRMPLPSEFDLVRMATKMRQEEPWLQEIHSKCFTFVAKRVHNAFISWQKGHKTGTGFPRFKSKLMFDSFTYNHKSAFSFVEITSKKQRKKYVRLGKIGLVKYSNPYSIEGLCKIATIYRKRIGNHYEWYASIAYENQDLKKDTEYLEPSMCKKDIGLDLGLDNLATLSDGTIIPNDRTYKRKEKELAHLQTRISSCEKGTDEYNKQMSKLSHKYKKMRNHRKDVFHKVSRELSARYGNVFMEDMSTEEMIEESPSGMKKSYRDASWNTFTRLTCYKVAETGHSVTFVNPAYTSQLCSSCGTLVPKDLSTRIHQCPQCGLVISRDENAAINILKRGLGLQTMII